jgi:hypothetical protein
VSSVQPRLQRAAQVVQVDEVALAVAHLGEPLGLAGREAHLEDALDAVVEHRAGQLRHPALRRAVSATNTAIDAAPT